MADIHRAARRETLQMTWLIITIFSVVFGVDGRKRYYHISTLKPYFFFSIISGGV
jgi:hypothetical protein